MGYNNSNNMGVFELFRVYVKRIIREFETETKEELKLKTNRYNYLRTEVFIEVGKYLYGKSQFIQLHEVDELTGDEYPVLTATVNVDGLKDGEIAIKNYSENIGVYDWLLQRNIITPAHREICLGYVTVPVCYLNKIADWLEERNVIGDQK
jgi:hypothetical protein